MTTEQQPAAAVREELSADYAWARPAPAAIRAAGYAAVWRYLSLDPSKNLTAAEAAALHAAGLGIGLVWETAAQRGLGGAAAGAVDGNAAATQARAIGLPPGAPLLANVGDFAAAPGDLDLIEAYYHAFRPFVSEWQAGGYATSYIIAGLVQRGAQGVWWQNAMDDQGVPGNVVSPHASVYQRVTPTRQIAGSKPGDWDEDVSGFGPARVNWWRAAPPPPADEPPGWQDQALGIASMIGTEAARLAALIKANTP